MVSPSTTPIGSTVFWRSVDGRLQGRVIDWYQVRVGPATRSVAQIRTSDGNLCDVDSVSLSDHPKVGLFSSRRWLNRLAGLATAWLLITSYQVVTTLPPADRTAGIAGFVVEGLVISACLRYRRWSRQERRM